MKYLYQKAVLLLFLLINWAYTGHAQSCTPATGTENFSSGAGGNISAYGPSPANGIVNCWEFTATGTGSGSINHNPTLSPPNVSNFMQGATSFSVKSSDGSEFSLTSFTARWFTFSGAYTITAYKDGAPLGTATGNATSSFTSTDLSGYPAFNNIDEIILTGFGGGMNVTFQVSEIIIAAPIGPNNAPTSSSFTATNGPYENLTYTFATSDFDFTDGDGDALDHIRVTTLPAAGTLYVDADNDNVFDGGEAVAANDQISKADLDAGNLQYIQNGSTNTSFAFDVNDGTDYSGSTYTATLSVAAVPTVTLALSPSSKSEGTSTTSTITANLSNAYGINTTVNLSFSGTATGSGVDYSLSGTSITIPAGSTTGSVNLTNVNDNLYEQDETVIIDISSVSGGNESGTQQRTYTIINDDAQPSATLWTRSIYNPITDESGGQAYIIAQIDAYAGTTVTVPLSFSGTASGGGTDYSITGSTITIPAGQIMDSIRVTSQYDGIEEGEESVIIDMGTPTNATESGTQQVTVTIEDEDATYPSVTISSSESSPTNSTTIPVTFTFSESVTGFTNSYITVGNGSVSNFAGSGDTYTVDVTPSGDGTVTVDVAAGVVTDDYGNDNTAASQFSITYDGTAPSGYSVSFDQTAIDPGNENAASFTFAGAEVGATYNYSISSSGDGNTATVTGSGTISTATDQITGIDVSALTMGTLTLSVQLTDVAGNTGSASTDTIEKDDKYNQTITFGALAAKTYGDADFDLTATASSGLDVTYESSDNTVASISGATVTILKAGTVNITAKQAGNGTYNAASDVVQSLTINKATLTATADDKTKVFGDPAPEWTVSYSGFVNSDDASVLDTAPTASSPVSEIFQTGNYDINVSGGVDNNYDFTYVDGIVAITKATLNVIAEDKSKTYGEANPAFTIRYDGFKAGYEESSLVEEPTISTSADANSVPGTYDLIIAGGSDNNYNYNYVNGTLTVTNAVLTVTADDKSKTYGDANPAFTVSYSGFVGGDDASVLDTAPTASTTADEASSVDTYDIVPAGGSDDYYDFSYVNGTLTVNKAMLTATADDKTKVFGEPAPEWTVSYSGFVNSDDASVLDTAPTASSPVSEIFQTGNYDINVSGGVDNNYDFTYVGGIVAITKATLNVIAEDKSKTYGEANPAFTISYDGFKAGYEESSLVEEPTISTSADANSVPGTYDLIIAGGSDNNYNYNYVNGTLTVTNAVLTVTADDKSKTYGEANPAFTVSYSGFVGGDDASVLDTAPTASTTADANSDAGNYDIVPAGGSDDYYDFSYVNGTLTVGKALLTATADNKTKVYGDPLPEWTVSYSGFVNSDDASVLDTAPTASSGIDETLSVGNYNINVSGGSDNNYDFAYVGGIVSITKAMITVSADDKTKTYGEANPSLTVSYAGFKNSDDESAFEAVPVVSTSADETSVPGTYDLTVTGASDNNYDFTYTNGTLTVNKATLTVTADDQQRAYTEANPEFTVIYSGWVNSDQISDLDTEPTVSTTAVAGSPAGTYDIVPAGGSDSNYSFDYVNGTLTIVNNAPVFTSTAITTIAEDAAYSYTMTISDADAGDSHTFTQVVIPSWLSLTDHGDGTATLNGTPANQHVGTHNVSVMVMDAASAIETHEFTITVTNTNDLATSISLSNQSIEENNTVGDLIGQFSNNDPDAGDTHTYSLVTGDGSEDNGYFTLTGDELFANAVFDYEEKNTFNIRVRVTDQASGPYEQAMVISIISLNTTPTDITLSNAVVSENQPEGTVVGQLTSEDADANEAFVYSLIAGKFDDDNELFRIEGDQLITAATFNFEEKTSYRVRIQTADRSETVYSEGFVITIADVNDKPHLITLSNDTTLEHQAAGTFVGYFETQDQDATDSHSYALVDGEGADDNVMFNISDDELLVQQELDYETQAEYSIRVQSTDSKGGTYEEVFIIKTYPDAQLELTIPSAFTPNGDGVNDTWRIDNIGAHSQIIVHIFEQGGKRLFNSVGYETPWDGTYKGQEVPTGTYYYVIKLPQSDLNKEVRTYQGSVMIIRN